jgi:hypothetical protein
MEERIAMTTEPNFETNRELDPCGELRKRLKALLVEMETARQYSSTASVITTHWYKKLKEAMK